MTRANPKADGASQLKDKANTHETEKVTDLGQRILRKRIEQLAIILSLDLAELDLWLHEYRNQKPTTLLSFVLLAIHHSLNPLLGEVGLWLNERGQAHPSITIDGWMKIINAQPTFLGIEFTQDFSSTPNCDIGVPESIQCTIYRTDRQHPISVREYYEEVKGDHAIWRVMPRRMLRHRALQQCARLAFGISTPEFAMRECATSIPATYGEAIGFKAPADLGDIASKTESIKGDPPPKKITRIEQLKVRLHQTTAGPKIENRLPAMPES